LQTLCDVFQIQDDESAPNEPFKLQGAKIGFCKTHNWPKAGEGTRSAMKEAMNILAQHGAVVEEFDMPSDFSKVLDWHATVL
jgi:Asp-tRNA(Asn)/Glu-tRNA(Gln) amidotransferase A subunit family amidase